MLRKPLLINLVVSLVLTVATLAIMPSPKGIFYAVKSGVMDYATNSALLSPIVFRNVVQ